MEVAKPVSSPMVKNTDELFCEPVVIGAEQEVVADFPYRFLIRSLFYSITQTRSDITFFAEKAFFATY